MLFYYVEWLITQYIPIPRFRDKILSVINVFCIFVNKNTISKVGALALHLISLDTIERLKRKRPHVYTYTHYTSHYEDICYNSIITIIVLQFNRRLL